MSSTSFFTTGGTLRHDAPSYVERKADVDLTRGLEAGEFCFILTSRQMGKSSLMNRTAHKLRRGACRVALLDLTAIGQNLTNEQWYDGLLSHLGRQLGLEDELDAHWLESVRFGPVQRFFNAIREVALNQSPDPLVIFVDEIDLVRSLNFSTDEFFAAIRECYNRRAQDSGFNRLTFCLLGVASPSELIRDVRSTPFNIGSRIELADFTEAEAGPFAERLDDDLDRARKKFDQIFHWTNGHPYLTQRMCRAASEGISAIRSAVRSRDCQEWVDSLCEELFLSVRAREQEDNLVFVRERLLRSDADLADLLGTYERVLNGEKVKDDEHNGLINHLRLAGIVDVRSGTLQIRNRIYERVFDAGWIAVNLPDAEIEKPDGQRIRLHRSCSIGRTSANDVVLADPKISRKHALIQAQKQQEFWLIDLGSRNGAYVNGKRVTQPVLLRNEDRIEFGPFRLVFRQSGAHPEGPISGQTTWRGSTQTQRAWPSDPNSGLNSV